HPGRRFFVTALTRGGSSGYGSAIRHGRAWGKRPTASLARDDWFGHRTASGEEFGDRDEYIDWDYALIEALETIEDFTDDNGLIRWEVEEDGVSVDSVRTFDKFQASID